MNKRRMTLRGIVVVLGLLSLTPLNARKVVDTASANNDQKSFASFLEHINLGVVHFFNNDKNNAHQATKSQMLLADLSKSKKYVYGGLAFVKADMTNPEVRQAAKNFGVQGNSTLVAFKDGAPLMKGDTPVALDLQGRAQRDAITSFIQKNLGTALQDATDARRKKDQEAPVNDRSQQNSVSNYADDNDDASDNSIQDNSSTSVTTYNQSASAAPYWGGWMYNQSPAVWSSWPSSYWLFGAAGLGYWGGYGYGYGLGYGYGYGRGYGRGGYGRGYGNYGNRGGRGNGYRNGAGRSNNAARNTATGSNTVARSNAVRSNAAVSSGRTAGGRGARGGGGGFHGGGRGGGGHGGGHGGHR